MRTKAAVPSSYDLNSRWVQQLSVDLDPPDLIRVCRSCPIPGISVRGWVGASCLSFFVYRQCGPRSDGISDFFHIHFLETKAPIRPAVRRLVWAFVLPMYQRRISRDKVHTIFKKIKLNVEIYSRNAPPPRCLCWGVYSFRLSVCPFVISYNR